jgi:hypothetical protein
MHIVVGLGFMLAHKPTFDGWQLANWTPTEAEPKYKPNRIGRLFAVGLGCAAVQVAAIFLLVESGIF